MDYEKKYKEANDKVAVRFGTNVAKEIFTDLYESEDERIRKELIEIIKSRSDFKQEYIAWLEKQGEKPTIIDIDSMVSKYANTKEACTNGLPVNCQIRAYRQGINDALRLSLNLEKQGEKEYKIQPKFKIGDIIRFKGNETLNGEAETHKIVSYDNELYVFADGTTDLFCEQDLYELVEQKPISFDTSTPVSYDDIPFGEKDYELHEATYFIPEGFHAEIEGDKVIIKRGEQNPAWSEEDEEFLSEIISDIKFAQDKHPDSQMNQIIFEEEVTWLKSLKQRIGG